MTYKPVIMITADHILVRDIMPAAAVYQVYSEAVIHAAGGLPWLLPPAGPTLDMPALLERIDGIVFTGARSNIEPHYYDNDDTVENTAPDRQRDSTTLPLIPQVIEHGIPMLCICRGLQELNVALGGSLHRNVSELPDKLAHFPPEDWPVEQRFAPSHEVYLENGGVLSALTEKENIPVNSVHQQCIDRLAAGLVVEASATDGIIEAVRVADSKTFACGVQWHPEWDWREHELNVSLWKKFGAACLEYATNRS